MALSDVMLLKPTQFTKHTRSHFGDSVLSKWYKSTVESLLENGEGAGTSIAKDIEGASANITEDLGDIAYDLMKGRIKTRQAVQRLVEISRNKENAEAQVLIGLSNLIQKLPRKKLLDNTTVGETELWSGLFDPALSALFPEIVIYYFGGEFHFFFHFLFLF
ncbi:hypothetical protein BDC45DRAFT_191814 [Circinella umbellata]|nr:hypothetical protein BDC45DRAFT_191814 [Circinella umbellata]